MSQRRQEIGEHPCFIDVGVGGGKRLGPCTDITNILLIEAERRSICLNFNPNFYNAHL